ncbi:MAG: hypothetical protein QXP02_05090 [Desulfurococcaceae archaeon]
MASEGKKIKIDIKNSAEIYPGILDDLVKKIMYLLSDDIRIRILRELVVKEALSIRAIARRSHCNYEKVERALKQLEDFGLIQTYVVNVSEHRRYKFYSINKRYESMLRSILENP